MEISFCSWGGGDETVQQAGSGSVTLFTRASPVVRVCAQNSPPPVRMEVLTDGEKRPSDWAAEVQERKMSSVQVTS